MKKICFVLVMLVAAVSFSAAEDNPVAKLKDETLQFFTPVSGKIVAVDGKAVIIEMDAKEPLRPGMRLHVLREGEPFRHPVTREVLGKSEILSGKVEIREIQGGKVTGTVIEGTAQDGDQVRISEAKVKMVFIQDKKTDWYLADDLYRRLKESNRIAMVDTGMDTDDEKKAVEEAKRLNADVALLLTSRELERGILLREQLFWVHDGARFFDTEAKVDIALAKELRFGEEFFSPLSGEAIFKYDLPFGARYVVTGDFDGDGKQEIALSTGTNIKTYLPAVDLQPLWELKGAVRGEHVWVDTIDLNGNGKDELIITTMVSRGGFPDNRSGDAMVTPVQPGDIVSSVYELQGTEFKKLWEAPYFLRKMGKKLIAQKYSASEGFKDEIFEVIWDGEFKRGDTVKLPRSVMIYDFIYVEGREDERPILAYDEDGFLNLFDDRGIRVWRSNANMGGFITTFKRPAAAPNIDRGQWSIKDRLSSRNKDIFVAQRVPLAEMVKGVGYKSSRIKGYWWNGFSMDERTVIDGVPGTLLDYAIAGDKMVVLASPFLGVKFENILKGENPLVSVLYIYSIRGR